MHARISHLLVACGCIALATVGACKSDSGTTPSNNTDFIPNPLGPLNLGDLVKLNVNGDEACSGAVYHTARVVAISSKAIILNDTLNPKNGFSTADYQRFATRFDTLVYPLDVANFGEPLDIDKNGHIAIVFTRAVNELTPARANSYVGG
ncbi:MAG: Peptidase hyicolysin, partial [Gemmatimonadetes bacterium]|nr:Peptidase hyicolysin [Gemmatimonadota bacterium]